MSQELDLDDLRKVAEAEETQKWGRWAVEEDDFDGYCVYINDGGIGRSYVAKDMHQGESEGESTAKFIATFNPATVLAFLNRLEQAEQQAKTVRELFETYEHRDKLEAYYRAIDGDDSLWQSLTGKPLDGDTRG